jgi:outer membrane murein-binding lipoprotein Lpp
MNKTRVDDLLIEMISPKIKEIEEKFNEWKNQGKGLSQDDINTLLLKSQYNHINHLDDKLNEVSASVIQLEAKFDLLDTKVTQTLERFAATMDVKIEKAINVNMRWSIGLIALIVTVLKLADMFV